MKVLLLGGHGLLGSALRASVPADAEVAAPRRMQVDVTDHAAVARAVETAEPAWIVNCAAMTQVDGAEVARDVAQELNEVAIGTIAAVARASGARVMHFSTDYVFDGPRDRPWSELDPPSPRSVYAATKRAGEERLLASGAESVLIRTGWLFGEGRRNFPSMMWERATARVPSRVVTDQVGTPTSTRDVASWCWALIAKEARGIYHATNSGRASWFEVAARIYARAGFTEGTVGVSSAEYGAKAPRPLFSVLDCAKLDAFLGVQRRPWDVALDEYLLALA